MIINELDYLENVAESTSVEGGLKILVLPLIEIVEETEGEVIPLKKSLLRGNSQSDLYVSVTGNGSNASASSFSNVSMDII
jgi:hypothetical protein